MGTHIQASRRSMYLTRTLSRKLIVTALLLSTLAGSALAMGARPPAAGMPAAGFSLTDLYGKAHSLEQYKGKIVLVNFWATWCKPCTSEMPAMQTVYDQLRDKDFVVLAVNELEDEAKVREHIQQYNHTFPVLLDRENQVANQYGVFGLPVSVFIDQQGVVQEYIKGGLLTERKIQEIVSRIQSAAPAKTVALR